MDLQKLTDEFLSLVQADNYINVYSRDIMNGKYFGLPLDTIVNSEKRLLSGREKSIAYFSMEYGLATSFYNKFVSTRQLDPKNKIQEQEVFSNFRLADYFFSLKTDNIMDLPIYSGGLGVLAGDTVKTMADYKLPAVAIGMLWSSGYFRQKFWFKYGQMPEEIHWDLATYPGLIPLKNKIKISLRNEDIHLRLWKYYVYSYSHDYAIPLVLLDSNVQENNERIRHLTDQLYRSDDVRIKIMQRVILGMGGMAALKELGYPINIYHMNEGHAVFSFIEKARGMDNKGVEELRKSFVYTCHTPVEAGHDRFSYDDLSGVLMKEDFEIAEKFGRDRGNINLTMLAMNAASFVNAVSRGHQRVMHIQFPKYKDMIKYVTNGVHLHTWMSDRVKSALLKHLGDIEANPMLLEKAAGLKADLGLRSELWQAHQENKEDLCNLLEKWKVDKNVFTICWARRVAAYKRPSLILQDVTKLIEIAKNNGPIQIIFAGKAHPKDNLGFTYISNMLEKVDGLTKVYEHLKIIMLENYDIYLAKELVSGVDVWLNNPLPPFEASGTSGMKAILNGVLQLSTLDGWVVEAETKKIGRIFGYRNVGENIGDERNLRIDEDSEALYVSLEELLKLYYKTNNNGKIDFNSAWIDTMIDCVACAGHFNTYRMLDEYKHNIWNIS